MLRRRVKALVDDVISPQLRENKASARLAVDMWERTAAEQARPGEGTNERFVRMARDANLTLVLILDELRDGTREELEAAVDDPKAQVAVLHRFARRAKSTKQSSMNSTPCSAGCARRASSFNATSARTPRMRGSGSSRSLRRSWYQHYVTVSRAKQASKRRRAEVTKRETLIAALLWHVPQLVQSDTESARAFVDSLSASPRLVPASDHDPLNLAATAILAGRQGDDPTLKRSIRSLRSQNDPVTAALALSLEWWLVGSEFTKDPLATADEVVTRLRGASLRARALVKLTTYSLDNHQRGIAAELLRRAIDTAPQASELRRALLITLSNEFGVMPGEEAFRPIRDGDELTHYDWIDALSLTAARSDLDQRLTDTARNPWSFTIRSGQTPLDSVVAAELQATWAGALWKRRPIQKQVGAQMLVGGARTPEQAVYGLARWVQGGGGDIPQLVDFAEPSFESMSVDLLTQQVLGPSYAGPITSRQKVELAANLWNLLSIDVLEQLMPRIPVDVSELGAPARFFWSRAALRTPRIWKTALRDLTATQRVALAGHLETETLNRMSKVDARKLLREIGAEEAPSEQSQAAGIVLAARLTGKPANGAVTPSVALRVAHREPKALAETVYLTAERSLADTLRASVEAARKGSFGLGTYSVPLAIGSVAEARKAIEDASYRRLTATAKDALAPGTLRLDSLVALARLAHVNVIPPSRYRRLKSVPPQQGVTFFDPISENCLRAGVLLLRSHQLTRDEQLELAALSRDPDTRTRQLTASAAAIHLTEHRSDQAEAALIASLYDPHHSVVRNALGVISQHRLRLSSANARHAIATRIVSLYNAGDRDVRRRSVAAARKLQGARGHDPQLADLIDTASADRSWLVRLDATGGEAGSARS